MGTKSELRAAQTVADPRGTGVVAREQAGQCQGMTPSRLRAGGLETEIRFAIGECSLGSILVSCTGGANALAVAIPSHRLVRTDGSLSGSRWGVERKRASVEREGRT